MDYKGYGGYQYKGTLQMCGIIGQMRDSVILCLALRTVQLHMLHPLWLIAGALSIRRLCMRVQLPTTLHFANSQVQPHAL